MQSRQEVDSVAVSIDAVGGQGQLTVAGQFAISSMTAIAGVVHGCMAARPS